jgi:hypothetical protein
MSKPESHLSDWTAAGLIDAETAARIAAFERERSVATAGERPGVMEVLVYLGVAVIAVGVFILVTVSWEDLDDWARVAVTGGPGLFALLMGQVMRGSGSPGLGRGGQMAWLVATALLAGSVAVIGANNDWAEENVVLGAALTGTLIAVALWAVGPSHPQVIALAGALLLMSMALGSRSDEFNLAVAGLTLAAFGGAGIALVESRLLTPKLSARPLAAAEFAFGTFWAGREAVGYEPLAFVAAGLLLGLGIWRGTFVYLIAGVALLFLALITTIIQHVEEPSAQAGALILLGALLVAVVLGMARWQPWNRATA